MGLYRRPWRVLSWFLYAFLTLPLVATPVKIVVDDHSFDIVQSVAKGDDGDDDDDDDDNDDDDNDDDDDDDDNDDDDNDDDDGDDDDGDDDDVDGGDGGDGNGGGGNDGDGNGDGGNDGGGNGGGGNGGGGNGGGGNGGGGNGGGGNGGGGNGNQDDGDGNDGGGDPGGDGDPAGNGDTGADGDFGAAPADIETTFVRTACRPARFVVRFASASADLDDDALATLTRAGSTARKLAGTEILITAGAEPPGDAPIDILLWELRAGAVAKAMGAAGVSDRDVTVQRITDAAAIERLRRAKACGIEILIAPPG